MPNRSTIVTGTICSSRIALNRTAFVAASFRRANSKRIASKRIASKRIAIKRIALGLCFVSALTHSAYSQRIIEDQVTTGTLAAKYAAAETRSQAKGAWVGFSIMRVMPANHIVGSYRIGGTERYPSIGELLASNRPDAVGQSVLKAAQNQLDLLSGTSEQSTLVSRELAILIRIEERTGTPVSVVATDLSSAIDLKGKDVYWLGASNHTESYELLRQLCHESSLLSRKDDSSANAEFRKSAMYAIGFVSQDEPRAVDFLKTVVTGPDKLGVRKAAVYALGWSDDQEIGSFLFGVALNDGPVELRKSALYSIANHNGSESLEQLASILDERSVPVELKKAALYSVANLDSPEAVRVLRTVLESDTETELRKAAAYALGNIGTPEAREILVGVLTN